MLSNSQTSSSAIIFLCSIIVTVYYVQHDITTVMLLSHKISRATSRIVDLRIVPVKLGKPDIYIPCKQFTLESRLFSCNPTRGF